MSGEGSEGVSAQEAVIGQYQRMREDIASCIRQIGSMEQELNEHLLVVRTLKDLDADRKCFRLVGGVLAEQNVGVVRPIVEANVTRIEEILSSLSSELEKKELEFVAFKNKYQIVERSGADKDKHEEDEELAPQTKGALI